MLPNIRKHLTKAFLVFAGVGVYFGITTAAIEPSLECNITIDMNHPALIYEDVKKLGLNQEFVDSFLKYANVELNEYTVVDARDILIDIIKELKRMHAGKPVGIRTTHKSDKKSCKRACEDTAKHTCSRYNCLNVKLPFLKNCCELCSTNFC